MTKVRQITAFFLLGSFLIMMVHSAIPHAHHLHGSPDGVAVITDHEHHSQKHDHDHHAHSDEKKPESQNQSNLLSFLVDSHSHFFHIHEVLQFTKKDPSLTNGKIFPTVAKITVFDFLSNIESQGLNKYVLTTESWSRNPFLLSCSLRAPPSIG